MARPLGSTTRPQIRAYLGSKKIKILTEKSYKLAEAGDVVMLRFLLEQIYGRAPQPITGEDGEVLQIIVRRYEDKDGGDKTPQVPG